VRDGVRLRREVDEQADEEREDADAGRDEISVGVRRVKL
jgi:hypothetical protein